MTTRTILTAVLVAVIAAAIATTALAASAAKDPRALVLQKADLPAAAKLAKKIADESAGVSSYSAEWRFREGPNQFFVVSVASVMKPGLAVATFRQARGFLKDGYRKITLPKYGDEQVAALAIEDNAGELWVRKGAVVWSLTVNTMGLDSGLITKSESIGLLKRFAPKQMRRVGGG